VTRWTPVKNLTFSAEVLYAYLKTNMAGTVNATLSSALPLATANYTYGNNDLAERVRPAQLLTASQSGEQEPGSRKLPRSQAPNRFAYFINSGN
jgi:hypothetical protein